MDQEATMVIEMFVRDSFGGSSQGQPYVTMMTDVKEDIRKIFEMYCFGEGGEGVVAAKARTFQGRLGDGRMINETQYYFADDDTDLKPITDIRFDGDYADQERQETFDFYDKKKVTHVFTIKGMHYDVTENTVVFLRDGTQIWPLENDAPENTTQNTFSSLDKQRHLRNYLRSRKPF